MGLSPDEARQQTYYRDARVNGQYDQIWQTVGKCVFCDLREKYIIYEEDGIVLTVALYAYIDGNVMIIPRRHVQSVKELTDGEWQTVRKLMYIAKKLIRIVHGIKGVQYIIRDGGQQAQSTVGHLHMHCIPFDAPDLSVWNFRKLQYTPLENANLYKSQVSEIVKLGRKFDEKYTERRANVHDIKDLYRQAVKQALVSKKMSEAKHTAKVGASIISGDKIISSCNANNTDGPMEQKQGEAWVSTPTVSHAEERCIAQAAKDGIRLNGVKMVVTMAPCMMCARLIVNSGIKELLYIDDWWDKNAIDFLKNGGVKVVRLLHKRKG